MSETVTTPKKKKDARMAAALRDALGTWDPVLEQEKRLRQDANARAIVEQAVSPSPQRASRAAIEKQVAASPSADENKIDDILRPGRAVMAPWGARHWRASVQIIHFDHGVAAQELLDSAVLMQDALFERAAHPKPKSHEEKLHYICSHLELLTKDSLLDTIAALRSRSWRVTVQFASDESIRKGVPIGQIYPLNYTIPTDRVGQQNETPSKTQSNLSDSMLRGDLSVSLNGRAWDEPAMTVPWHFKQQRAIIALEYLHRDYLHGQRDSGFHAQIAAFHLQTQALLDRLRHLRELQDELDEWQTTEPIGRRAVGDQQNFDFMSLVYQEKEHRVKSSLAEEQRRKLERDQRQFDDERQQADVEVFEEVIRKESVKCQDATLTNAVSRPSLSRRTSSLPGRREPFKPTSLVTPVVDATRVPPPPTFRRLAIPCGPYRIPTPKEVETTLIIPEKPRPRSTSRGRRVSPARKVDSSQRPQTPPPRQSGKGLTKPESTKQLRPKLSTTSTPAATTLGRSSTHTSSPRPRLAVPSRYAQDNLLFPTSLESYVRACSSVSKTSRY